MTRRTTRLTVSQPIAVTVPPPALGEKALGQVGIEVGCAAEYPNFELKTVICITCLNVFSDDLKYLIAMILIL